MVADTSLSDVLPDACLVALDHDHVEIGSTYAFFFRSLIFRRVVHCLCLFDAVEFHHDDAMRFPVAFEYLGRAPAGQKLAAIFGDRVRCQFPVLAVRVFVEYFRIGDDVAGMNCLPFEMFPEYSPNGCGQEANGQQKKDSAIRTTRRLRSEGRICRFGYLRVNWDGWDGAIWRSLRLKPGIRNSTIGDSERDGHSLAHFGFGLWIVLECGGTGRYRNRRKRA